MSLHSAPSHAGHTTVKIAFSQAYCNPLGYSEFVGKQTVEFHSIYLWSYSPPYFIQWVVTCEPKLPFTYVHVKAAHFGPDVIKGDLYLWPLQTPKDTAKPVPGYRTFPTHSQLGAVLELKCILWHFSTSPFFSPAPPVTYRSHLPGCCSCPGILAEFSNFIMSHEMMQSNEKLQSALTPIFQSASSTHLWSAITQNKADLLLWIKNSGSSCKTWKQSIYPGPPAEQKETQFHIFPQLFAEQAPS